MTDSDAAPRPDARLIEDAKNWLPPAKPWPALPGHDERLSQPIHRGTVLVGRPASAVGGVATFGPCLSGKAGGTGTRAPLAARGESGGVESGGMAGGCAGELWQGKGELRHT